mgnify:CR=1 FL=1
MQQINSISEYVNQLTDKNDFVETDVEEREEWMILADLKLKSNSDHSTSNEKDLNCQADHYYEDRSNYTMQQIEDMPQWIDKQKTATVLETEETRTNRYSKNE